MGLHIIGGIDRLLKLFCDNKLAILYFNNNRSSTMSEHIDIKFLIVKKRIQSEQLFIEYVSTNSMIVDLVCKGLLPKLFYEHSACMSVLSINDI